MDITGGIVNKCDIQYSDARLNYNRAFNNFPCEVIFCFTDEDISNAIKYVKYNKLKFRIRSGRHDYEANSNIDRGVVIDISNINYVLIDGCKKVAKLGAGILSGKMYEELSQNNYTIPSGTCSDVGFCGLTTCGGVGFASRYLGLACDNLLEAEVINYQGDKVVANEYQNSDLFWALRGGLGANFGVVVSLTYKITPVCKVSTYVIRWDLDDFIDVFNTWQNTTPFLDNRLSTDFVLKKYKCGEITVTSAGQFFGSEEELLFLIKDLLEVAKPISIEIETLSYLDAVKKWNSDCTPPEKFKGTGSFIYEPITIKNLEFIKDAIINSPDGSESFFEFMGLLGKVSEVISNETAFVHRQALYLTEIKSTWFSENNKFNSNNWVELVKNRFDTFGNGTYRGFTDFNIINWQEQYYGENYKRLQIIKKKYDPQNFFSFPQSIQI